MQSFLDRRLLKDHVFGEDSSVKNPIRATKVAVANVWRLAGFAATATSFALIIVFFGYSEEIYWLFMLLWIIAGMLLYCYFVEVLWRRTRSALRRLYPQADLDRPLQEHDADMRYHQRDTMLNAITVAILGAVIYAGVQLWSLLTWLPSPLQELGIAVLLIAGSFWFFLLIPIKEWLKHALGIQ